MSADTDLAWAAGFLDGEGCFACYEREQNGRWYWRPIITAPQVEREPLERLQSILGGRLYHSPMSRYGANKQDNWVWRLNSRSAIVEAIERLRPYLSGPKRRAAAEVVRRLSYKTPAAMAG